ncbi:probable serine/threonine-protein kinase DDB_G0282963 [Condylostylus longicornis]|uniref:probable serine/threonine-protein kinase DDB_G0282963 n=1 Tax=Condylostylus longicornis TaxID=2530218 RepID=UPI00244D9CF1|nr:probable serine/threonine-protein kinase DDB_G0282963 [Condylostylus longicornis]
MFSSKSKQIRLLSTSGSNSNSISGNANNVISGSSPNLNSNFGNNTTNSNHKSDDSTICKNNSGSNSSGGGTTKLSLSSENVRKNSIESVSGNNTKSSPSKLSSDKCNSSDQKSSNASNNSSNSNSSSSGGGLSYFSSGSFTRIFKSSASFVQNPFNISSYSNSSNSSNSNSNSNSPSNNKTTSNSTANSQTLSNNEIINNKSVPTTKNISSSKVSTTSTTNTISGTTTATFSNNNSKAAPLAISNTHSAIKIQNERLQTHQSSQKSSTFLKAFSNSSNNNSSIVVDNGDSGNDSNESLKSKNSKDLNNSLSNSIGHKNSENIFKTIKKTGTGILSPEDKKLTTSSSLASNTKSQQANFSTNTTTNSKSITTSNTTNLTRNGSIPKKDTISSSSSATSIPSTIKSSTKSKSSGNDLIRISSASDMFKTVGDLVGKRSKKSHSVSSSSGTSITKVTSTTANINSKNTDSKNVIITSTVASSTVTTNNTNLIIPNGYPGQKISKDNNINSKSIVQNNNSKSASPFFKPITQAIKRIDNNNSTTVTQPQQLTSSASSSSTLSLTMNNGNVQGVKSLHINKTQLNELSPSGIPINTSKTLVKLNDKTGNSGSYTFHNKKSPSSEQQQQQQKTSDFRSKYKSPLDMSIILPQTISSDLNDNSINFDNDHEVEQTIDRVEEVLAAMENSARLGGNSIVNNTDSPLMSRFLSPTNDLNRPQQQQPITSNSIALQQFQQYQSLKNPPSILLSQQQQQQHQHHQTATVSPYNFTTTITKSATLSCSDINELEEKVSSAISSEVACLKIVETVDDISSNPIAKLRKSSSNLCSTTQQQRNLSSQMLKQVNTSIENNNYTTTPPPPPAPSGQPQQQQQTSSFISYIIASTTDLPDIEEEDILTDSPTTPISTNTVIGSGNITNCNNNNNTNVDIDEDDEFYSASSRNPFNNLGQTLRYPSHSNLTAVEKYPDLRKLASSSTVSSVSVSSSISSSPSLIQQSNFDPNRTKTFNNSGSPLMSSEDIRKKIQLESSANALYHTLTKKNKQQLQQHPTPPDSLDLSNINSNNYNNYENHIKNLSEINSSSLLTSSNTLTVGCNVEIDDNTIRLDGILGGTGSTFNDILSDSIVETPELNSNATQFGTNICNGITGGGIFSSGGILTSATGTTTTPSSITSNFRFNGNNDISVNNNNHNNNNISNCHNSSNSAFEMNMSYLVEELKKA